MAPCILSGYMQSFSGSKRCLPTSGLSSDSPQDHPVPNSPSIEAENKKVLDILCQLAHGVCIHIVIFLFSLLD